MFRFAKQKHVLLVRRVFPALLLAIFFSLTVSAQQIQRIGSPLVQQYTKAEYRAGNQNWAIASGPDGLIYAGNTEGLLVFDGQHWAVHQLPNGSTVRSVAVADDGKIYT